MFTCFFKMSGTDGSAHSFSVVVFSVVFLTQYRETVGFACDTDFFHFM